MSSYRFKARNLKTNEIQEFWAIDDYFAPRVYSCMPSTETGKAMTETEFCSLYESVDR